MSGTNQMSLGVPQVATIVDQAVREAQARNVGATIAVVDRVGNVLAVVETGSAPRTIRIGSNPAVVAFPGNGLEDVPGGATQGDANTPAAVNGIAAAIMAGATPQTALAQNPPISARFAAISKAITAAYLSTEGNAFTTETASQIIQENFNPGQGNRAGGPLFGVQFSQLVCDDIARRQAIVGGVAQGMAGPKSAPIGFSGDPGGIPLYMSGEAVGGIGVEVDGTYSVQTNIVGRTFVSLEALIALAGQRGFRPNRDRRADLITVDGLSLRYTDSIDDPFASQAAGQLVSSTGAPAGSQFVDVLNFFQASGGMRAGTVFLTPASGYRPAMALGTVALGAPARVLVTPDDTAFLGQNIFDPSVNATAILPAGSVTNPRASFSPTPGNGGLTDVEAATLVASGLSVARQSRAQIRRGIGGPGLPFMQVNVGVVDLAGNVLAFAGTPDAPVFGTAVSIQKARGAAFISRAPNGADPAMPTSAADDLQADVETTVLLPQLRFQSQPIGMYVSDVRNFLQDPTALENGIAFADRSIGNLSRPFFPDGINDNSNGPLSQPIPEWSPFNTGFQVDLILDRLLIGLLTSQEGNPAAIVTSCTGPTLLEMRGGIQIFPGSVPIFKNGKLVGGLGVSGDGVDQDDLIAFEGAKRAGIALGGTGIGGPGMVGNAPRDVRSDQIRVPGMSSSDGSGNLRYVNCPQSPFLNGGEQNVCGRGDM